MSSLLLPLSDAFSSAGSCVSDVFSKVVALNYHIGGAFFSAIQYVYFIVQSVISTVVTGIGLALEDLVVFLIEISDVVSAALDIIIQTVETIVTCITSFGKFCADSIAAFFYSIVDIGEQSYNLAQICWSNIMLFMTMLGRSVVMMGALFSQTVYLTVQLIKSSVVSVVTNSKSFSKQVLEELYTAPPEVYIGLVVAFISTVFISKVVVRKIRESNLTLERVASFLLYIFSTTYVLLIRTCARIIGLIFTIIEVTVNNIRLPMFSHAGDSDEDSDDEDNSSTDGDDRRKLKRFDILANAGLEEDNSVEGELFRQVQREREDKLCVVCVDKSKCVMMLPCRHLCVCERCWSQLERADINRTCPLCRKPVQEVIKAYL